MRTTLLDALQSRVRSLMQPLYNEQIAFRMETAELLDAALRRTSEVEERVVELHASVLHSRWLESPNVLASRKETGHWLNWLGLQGKGVEVGVFQGEFSYHLLSTWQCSRLTSVDSWKEFSPTEYVDACNASQAQHDFNYAATTKRLTAFGDRSELMRTTSADAANAIESRSLDFAYLDAQHHYEAVRDDIALWSPKIRSGGVIGGHDYLDGRLPSGLYGVKTAVDEFVAVAGYELVVTHEPAWPSWFAIVA